ncbi:MAG: tRNA lysidine(34) synthetase TilS, partial [Clostridia bacterium]|nr:tRNA lysidine(34) synthetase TilS [Clostridia bacterium]
MSELNDSRLFAEGMPGDIDAVAFEQDVSDLPEKVDRFIAEKELLRKDESVLIGLSGGADSVALLVILKQLAPRYGWKLNAAHFNHGIRGVGAEDDQLFCRDLCDMMGVPFYTETGDVPAYARENGMSIETAGRLLRYDFLGRIKEKTGCTAIAVAHHMNDNAESILLHLVRGSGLRGLIGINPRRDDVIRPLLCVMKDEIEKYLEREGIAYHTDETNLIADGSRNRIRLDVMPYLMKHINPGIVPTLCGMSELLSQDENYLA